ncbi:unnamed protein product [Parnassius apollo]|uniref:(apollo) hypothetical protein n=1 Tax=Parnassius apollo TaxID=110799 RepID=A0A8S3XS05_PARAO|nr:unnamed protein product [Parnassius apollo]
MKIVAVIFLAALSFVSSEYNGRYRQDPYANSGRSRFPENERYNSPFGIYNNNVRNNARFPYKPYTELSTPYSTNSDKKRNNAVQVLSTYRPVTVTSSTAAPVYTMTPKSSIAVTVSPVYQRSNTVESNAKIVNQDSDLDVNNYRYSYLTENGISAGESGIVDPTENGGGSRVKGFYEYYGTDGTKYRVDYTADENGFHPTGAHLP